VLLGVPAFSLFLVFVHAVHGLTLDWGARRAAARPHRSQAVRFGLYLCGLDLLTSPIGAVYVLLHDGVRAAFALLPASIDVPRVAVHSLLGRVYRLDEIRAASANRFASAVIAVVGLAGVIAVMCGLVLALVL